VVLADLVDLADPVDLAGLVALVVVPRAEGREEALLE